MEFVGTAEKVSNGKVIKDCAEEALRLNPNDGSAHYILGRFYSELLKVIFILFFFLSCYFYSEKVENNVVLASGLGMVCI